QQALDNIHAYPHCVLLTRVGGFYELYFDHAESYHQELGLKRSFKDTKLGPVAMAGFPFFQLDRFVKLLVQDMGKFVAISEEVEKDPLDVTSKNAFDRKVLRVITPGTLLDEKFLEQETNNYLLSVHIQEQDNLAGLAWMDLSTGDFLTQEVSLSGLASSIQRLQPKEIIGTGLAGFAFTPVEKAEQISDQWKKLVKDDFSLPEALAGSTLLAYIAENLKTSVVTPPVRVSMAGTMRLDYNAIHSLELRRSMMEQGSGYRGSLLHALRGTLTKSGSRLLATWIVNPITSVDTLNQRLDLVTLLLEDEELRSQVQRFLKNSGDAVRVLQRFGFGRGEVEDLLTISASTTATESLLALLSRHARAEPLRSRMTVLDKLRKKITASVDEEGLSKRNREDAETAARVMQEVMQATTPTPERRRKAIERDVSYTMRSTASTALKHLHQTLADLSLEKEALQMHLRQELGDSSLTLKTLPGLSHIAHVRSSSKALLNPDVARAVGSTRSTRSYHIAAWSLLGTRIEATRLQIQREETQTFHALRKLVLQNMAALRENAQVLDELDVACNFAQLASQHNWVRPILEETSTTEIIGGRHPVVEFSLLAKGQQFQPNDCHFGEENMYLITGCNMGGKSTFLRTAAVIQILAQIGSYVPARHARLGIVDQIFSRLGSADSLYQDESTFLVEMKETSAILSGASGKSLVLMDEVGRGTTFVDGISIAYATLEKLQEVGCRTLFATHFHDLAKLMKDFPRAGMLYTDLIEEEDGSFTFEHQMKRGVCTDSHGLKVARIAGIEQSVLDTAQR
ncbi:muts domain V-domain-containing protein, partial [Protomyces lactucae-debilis]